MIWRHKRKQTKGWASDIEDNGPYGEFRERLATSGKLWATCLILVLASVVLLLVHTADVGPSVVSKDLTESPVGMYRDSLHTKFVNDLKKSCNAHGVGPVDAKFLSGRRFRITIPEDLGQDEIGYLSRFAATGIYRRFGVSPTVWTYIRGNSKPVATTTWSPSRGDFVVEFGESAGSE